MTALLPHFLLFVSLLNAVPSLADESPRTDAAALECPVCKGWYWTDILPPEKNTPEVTEAPLALPKPVVPPPLAAQFNTGDQKELERKLMDLHPDQFDVLTTAYLKKGVWRNTHANLHDIYTIYKVYAVKNQAYASTAMAVTTGDPNLSFEHDIPLDGAAIKMQKDAELEEMRERITREKDNWLLVCFKSERCPACKAQREANRLFHVETGMGVKEIDLEEEPDTPALLGVDHLIPGYSGGRPQVPVMMLGYRTAEMREKGEDTKFHPIAAGPIGSDEMKVRVYRAMRLLSGEITEEQWALYEMEIAGNRDPAAIRGNGGKK